jgi:hypothetical protein
VSCRRRMLKSAAARRRVSGIRENGRERWGDSLSTLRRAPFAEVGRVPRS